MIKYETRGRFHHATEGGGFLGSLVELLCASLLFAVSPAIADESVVAVRAGAPGVLAIVVETQFIEQGRGQKTWPGPAPNLDLEDWSVNGNTPQSIYRYSIPYDELKRRRGSHPVKVRHRMYLDTGQPLKDGKVYNVVSPYGTVALTYRDAVTRCEAIKINQGGYHPRLSDRFANFGVFLGDGGSRTYTPPPAYEILRVSDQTIVDEGKAVYLADDTMIVPKDEGQPQYTSGEHVYRLSLNEVPQGGPYVVVVPGCGRSYPFEIGMKEVRATARQAMRGIYHQRCGLGLEQPYTEHTRAVCALSHRLVADTRQTFDEGTGSARGWISVSGSEPLREVVGGWHDAGDFDRRISHIYPLMWWLSYYEALQDRAPWNNDGWLNIPESGNGVPDFLDEARWALQSWEDLQITDASEPDVGGVLAGTEADRHPGYGKVSAASDKLVYGTYAVGKRITAWSAGAFAHMARLIEPYDATHAAGLRNAAELAWGWMERNGLDMMITPTAYAAVQLYLTTREETYHEIFKDVWSNLHSKQTKWPEACRTQNWSAQCQFAQFAMYFHPRHASAADSNVVQAWLAELEATAGGNGYHCDHPANEPIEPYPHCIRAYGDWGAQVTTGVLTDHWIWAWILLENHPDREKWFDAAALLSQFPTGLNPMNMSFFTQHGSRYPISTTHLDSYFTKFGVSDGVTYDHVDNPKGQVPGLLIFGPTQGRRAAPYQRAVTDKLYPSWKELPRQRRWGDGWSAINQNEIATRKMAYQALLHMFLASVEPEQAGDE